MTQPLTLLTAAQDADKALRAAERALEEAATACAVAKQVARGQHVFAAKVWGDRVGRTRTLAAELRRVAGRELSRGNVLR
jgi:uncharacterized protein involved in tolerance to divalent cations